MPSILRPYQDRAVHALRRAMQRSPVYVAPTGSGKTIVSKEIARLALAKGNRTLFVAHSREVVQQSATALSGAIFAAGMKSDLAHPIQCGLIHTLASRIKRGKPVPAADLVIWDECDLVRATTYERVRDHYQGVPYLGLTATPSRRDGAGLGAWFGEIVQTTTVAELIEAGHLASYTYYGADSPDLNGVRSRGGDYAVDQLAVKMQDAKLVGDLVTHYKDRLSGQTALCFAVRISHSEAIVSRFKAAGIPAAHVDGNTPKAQRDATFARLASGELKVVANCAIVSRGYDCPSLGGVILARPTQSLALARQQVGRALRPPGPVVILDHAGLWKKHGLPVDEPEWTLDDSKKANEAVPTPAKRCKECLLIIPLGCVACPMCGAEITQEAEDPEEAEGTLVEVASMSAKQSVYGDLLKEAHARNWKKGWASVQYKARFRVWPVKMAALVKEEVDKCPRDECIFCESVLEVKRKWG